MAKIIYKNGHVGENKIESIEGIEISLLNGQMALIYPRYAKRVLLETEKIKYYEQEPDTEMSALKKTDNLGATGRLDACSSPAVEFVAQFHSDKYGIFALPTLLAAMEIQYQKEDIDKLAEAIEGADLLRDFTSYVWSCSRCSEDYGWIADGGGFVGCCSLGGSVLAVPTILY